MVMERPPREVVPPFALWFPDIVEQSRPAKVEGGGSLVRGCFCHIVQHFEGMIEIVFVGTSVACLHEVELTEFGQDDLEQPTAIEVVQAFARCGGHHDFVQLVGDALPTDDVQPFGIPFECVERLFFNHEVQLGSEAYAAEHAQRVVGESDIRVERCAYDAVLQVVETSERIDEFAEALFVQANRHRVDGEIASVLVILQRTVFHDGFARSTVITLPTRTHKFYLTSSLYLQLCRSEVFEHRKMCLFPQSLFEGLCHGDAAAHDHHVNIVRRAFEEDVAHVATHHITFHPHLVGDGGNHVEYRLV